MRFRFGCYHLFVDGNKTIISLLSSQYQKYLTVDGPADYEIHFEVAEEDTFGPELTDGWSLNSQNDYWQLDYHQNNKAIFALRKGRTFRDITVFVNKPNDIPVKIGMQYATMLALYEKCIGLHGVTVLCGDKVIILSAPSGTGKTTLAHLLEKYGDAIVINGDFAMISIEGDEVVFEPTPFCGTSRRSLNQRLRIDQLVFLEQSQENRWKKISGRQAVNHLLSNSFVPIGDKHVKQMIQQNAIELLERIQVSTFAFAPEREAAVCFMDSI